MMFQGSLVNLIDRSVTVNHATTGASAVGKVITLAI